MVVALPFSCPPKVSELNIVKCTFLNLLEKHPFYPTLPKTNSFITPPVDEQPSLNFQNWSDNVMVDET